MFWIRCWGQRCPAPLQGALNRVLLLDQLTGIYDAMRSEDDGRPFVERLLTRLSVEPRVSPADLARIPKTGPVVVVANHPFGLIEGAILTSILSSIRPDVKVMANFLLSLIPELQDQIIFVDPFGGDGAIRANQKGLKSSIAWLKQGGMLLVFPAGEVAHLNLKERAIVDPQWSSTIARIIRITQASVLPVYFQGANSALFQILGLMHPRVRTALIPHEFLNKRHSAIELRIGNPIAPQKLGSFESDTDLIGYLRHRTYMLRRQEPPRMPNLPLMRHRTEKNALEPVIPAVPREQLTEEIARLGPNAELVDSAEFSVLIARAHQIPGGLREIGRLREIAFRQVGEGTGKSIDLDAFDNYYLHLFVWNKDRQEIVGAYRMGPAEQIMARFGTKGLYTNTLFAYRRAFLDRISPALELGRSFVRVEYQKNYAPLLLLWKGISHFVARHPEYRFLFGPVSISNDYTLASRQLMVTFLNSSNQSQDLTHMVRARKPFRTKPLRGGPGAAVCDMEELSALIADIETDQKGVPILLKQYLKLGGKLVAFNVDSHFADAVDGLIVVDLTQTDPRTLERYMGKEAATAYFNYHRSALSTTVPA